MGGNTNEKCYGLRTDGGMRGNAGKNGTTRALVGGDRQMEKKWNKAKTEGEDNNRVGRERTFVWKLKGIGGRENKYHHSK